jgi:hypothetical protein
MILQSFVAKSLSSAVFPKFSALLAQRYDDQYEDDDQQYDQQIVGHSIANFIVEITLILLCLMFSDQGGNYKETDKGTEFWSSYPIRNS